VKKQLKVWELQIFGSLIVFNSLDDLLYSLKCDLSEIEEGADISISPKWMTQKELISLPEFDGF